MANDIVSSIDDDLNLAVSKMIELYKIVSMRVTQSRCIKITNQPWWDSECNNAKIVK